LRVGDILAVDFKEKYNALKEKHVGTLSLYPDFTYDNTEYEQKWFAAIEELKRFTFIENEVLVNQYINDDVAILAEGAQGSLLDIDFGTYPFVTSSNTMAAGVCTGLGIAPSKVGKVFGIFKAYCTRVGSGPFPTELFDDMGEYLRQAGHEFGATTGRPRRCGWLDMVALKYAVMMNGVTDLIMMKSDILNDLDTIKVAVGYKKDGEVIDWFPYDGAENIEPVYKEFKGWKSDICGIRDYESLPQEFKDYVAFIEKETGVNVRIISVGPDREATIVR
jgi:adenylosuccinate synthase